MNINLLTHTAGIYRIYNKITKTNYIGQSKDIKTRIQQHFYIAYHEFYHEYNYPLYKSIRKYGKENFDVYVLEECDISALDEREIYWISVFNSYKKGYNQTTGGRTSSREPPFIVDLINDLKNTTLSYQELSTKYNLSLQQIGLINRGRHYKKAQYTYPLRPWIKEVVYCDPITCEIFQTFESVTEAANFVHSSTTAISQVCLGRYLTVKGCYFQFLDDIKPQRLSQNARIVLQIDPKTNQVINEFTSLQDAANAVGVKTKDNIGRVCRGERITCKGYRWQYKI